MKNFNDACQNSKTVVLNEQKSVAERQHKDIVNAIRKEYGIDCFSKLTESEKKSYHALILEMWDPETGLTKKGIRFINESKSILTPESTDEQIEKYFLKEMLPSIKGVVAGQISMDRVYEISKQVKSDMEEMHKSNVSSKMLKESLWKEIAKEVAKVIRAFKLN